MGRYDITGSEGEYQPGSGHKLLRNLPGRAGGTAMSRAIVNQEASVNLPVRAERDFRRFSMSSIRSPVSMALELATALRMLARGTDTLPVLFLRTMGRLQNKMIARIITLGRPAVLSAFRQGSRWKVDTNNAVLTELELSSCRHAPLTGKPEPLSGKWKSVDHYTEGEPLAEKMARLTEQLREQFAESDRLEAEIKQNLGGLGYDC